MKIEIVNDDPEVDYIRVRHMYTRSARYSDSKIYTKNLKRNEKDTFMLLCSHYLL